MKERYYDIFISYARKDSMDFAVKINNSLTERGLRVWFDKDSIEKSVDFKASIRDGIIRSHNVLYIMSPRANASPYCRGELDQALEHHKRIIPVVYIGDDEENVYEKISLLNRILPTEQVKDTKSFDKGVDIDPFEYTIDEILKTVSRDRRHTELHTRIYNRALYWDKSMRDHENLLVGSLRFDAENWLEECNRSGAELPNPPQKLHYTYICESRRNSHNLMSDVVVCYHPGDIGIYEQIQKVLEKNIITTECLVLKEECSEYKDIIDRGDNTLFLFSEAMNEVSWKLFFYAASQNKRIISLLTDTAGRAEGYREEVFDFSHQKPGEYSEEDIYDLCQLMKENREYHNTHKKILVKAARWKGQDKDDTYLLRGAELKNCEQWLKSSADEKYPPTDLHREFIENSIKKKGLLKTDVFISYSRKDSDFVRLLNERLQREGITTWLDLESLARGQDFHKAIMEGIEKSDNFLFLISENSLESPYCMDEMKKAGELNKRITTILYGPEETLLDHEGMVPVQNIQWIDFYNVEDREVNPIPSDRVHDLTLALRNNIEYVRMHTDLHQKAQEWSDSGKKDEIFMTKKLLEDAVQWKSCYENTPVSDRRFMPAPTKLQREYIGTLYKVVKQEEEKSQRILKRTQIFSAVLVFLLISACFAGLYAYEKSQEAGFNLAKVFEEKAVNSITQDRPRDAILYTAAAYEQDIVGYQDHVTQKELLNSIRQGDAIHAALKEKWASPRVNIHDGGLLGVTFSPGGNYMATCSSDKTIALWSLKSGEEIHRLKGHSDSVTDVVFSENEKYLFSSSLDGTLRKWSVKEGSGVILSDSTHRNITSLAVTDSYLIEGYGDNTILLRDLESYKTEEQLRGHRTTITDLAVSSDRAILASASRDRTISLWSLEKEKRLKTFRGHKGWVLSLDFSSDNMKLISCSDRGEIILWSVSTGKKLMEKVLEGSGINAVTFLPDSNEFIAARSDGSITLFSAETLEEIDSFRGHKESVTALSILPEARLFASASEDQTVRLWDIDSRKELTSYKGHTQSVNTVAYSPRSGIWATGGEDNTIRFWDLERGLELKVLKDTPGHVSQTEFSEHGDRLYYISGEKLSIQSMDGEELVRPEGEGVLSLAAGRKYLAAGTRDKRITIRDKASGEILKTLEGHSSEVISLAWHPSGEILASGDKGGEVRIWHLEKSGSVIKRSYQPYFSLPGGQGAQSSENSGKSQRRKPSSGLPPKGQKESEVSQGVKLPPEDYDQVEPLFIDDIPRTTELFRDGMMVMVLPAHEEGVNTLQFAPEGQYLLTASDDRNVRMWHGTEGVFIGEFPSHREAVTSLDIHPEGKTFLTATDKGDINLWSVDQQKILFHYKGHRGGVTSVKFSRKGSEFVSTSLDNTLRLWTVDPRLRFISLSEKEENITSMAVVPRESSVVSGSVDSAVSRIKLKGYKGHSSERITEYDDVITSMAVSPSGEFMASGTQDGKIYIRSLKESKDVKVLQGHSGSITSLSFTPDGRHLASASWDQTVRIWSLHKEEPAMLFKGFGWAAQAVDFSSDGEILASGYSGGAIRLWLWKQNIHLTDLKGHKGDITSLDFSSRGRVLASSSGDTTVRIWSLDYPVAAYVLKGHEYEVNSVKFSPDGTILISGSSDKSIKIWSANTMAEIHTLKFHNRVQSLDFIDDGSLIAYVLESRLEYTDISRFFSFLDGINRPTDKYKRFMDGVSFYFQKERDGLDLVSSYKPSLYSHMGYNFLFDEEYRSLLDPPEAGMDKFDQILKWAEN